MADDKIKVTVADSAGAKSVQAELPADAPMSRLVPALVNKMQLPTNTQYKAMHKESGKELGLQDTLKGVGVKEGDTIRLLPNVVAG